MVLQSVQHMITILTQQETLFLHSHPQIQISNTNTKTNYFSVNRKQVIQKTPRAFNLCLKYEQN